MKIWTAMSVSLLCAACAGGPGASMTSGLRAEAKLESRSNSVTTGVLRFREATGAVLADVEIRGLAPNSEHGFHVHEQGDCSAPDASSAGGHFNPTAQPHGLPGGNAHHVGDIRNLRADENGVVKTQIALAGVTLAAGANSIVGRSVIVHRDPDDYTSQPAGNSGPRIACGVITAR